MTRIEEEEARILESGKNALMEMAKRQVSLHPKNYVVWYEYCLGSNPELVADIDRFIESGEPLSNRFHEQLYDKYFVNGRSHEITQRVSDETQTVLRNILDKLMRAMDFSKQYQDKLDQCSAQLQDLKDPPRVQALVEHLIQYTNAMANSSRELQERLAEESARAERLQMLLDQTKREAMTDQLTGLFNRKALDQELEDKFEQFRKKGKGFSVLMLDVDLFKKLNDAYGHVIGDAVLRNVARRIGQHVKGGDFAARYGGEEFAVLLPDTKLYNAIAVAEHIRAAVENMRLKILKNNELLPEITISIGAAEVRKDDTADSIFDRADEALYLAKHSGRNNVKMAV